MNRNIFIDTCAFIGFFHKKDAMHKLSMEIWEQIRKDEKTFVTTNHVLDELATLLGRKTDFSYSARKMKRVYTSGIYIERSTEIDELRALDYFEKYADQNVSFTDCLSFVMMEKLSIKQVFTFDRHFEYAGFEKFPRI